MKLLHNIVFYILSILFFLSLNVSLSQVTKPVEVKTTSPERIEAKPKKTISPSFLVKNNSDKKRRFLSLTILPPKWKLNPPDGYFELDPGESDIKIINISIPADAQSDSFKVSYTIQDAVDPSVNDAASLTIFIPPVTDVKFELIAKPKFVLAGNDFKILFKMRNESNLTLVTSLGLIVSGHPEFKVTGKIDTVNFKLEPGSERNIEISGTTDSKIDQKRNYNFHVIPTFSNIKDSLNFQFYESIEIVPNKYVIGDIWHRIPINFTMRAVTENQPKPMLVNLEQNPPRLYGFQGEISGKGRFYEGTRDRFEFLIKAPNIQEKAPSFWKRDEYYFKYVSDNYDFVLGDNFYNLSFLTDLGNYALGGGGNYKYKNYEFGGYAQNNRWSQLKENTVGAYASFGEKNYAVDSATDLYRIRVNLADKNDQDNRVIASLQGFDNHYSFANIGAEFGVSQGKGLSGNAYKIDLSGKLLFAEYNGRILKGSTDFLGSFKDISLINGSIRVSPLQKLSFSSYYNRAETNLEHNPIYGSAPRNSLIQFGVNNEYFFNFGLMVYRYDWDNDLKENEGFREDKVQLTSSYDFGLYRFFAMAEFSNQTEKLSQKTLLSKRLFLNSSFNIIDRFDFSVSANYTEMGNLFLFDNVRAVGLGLNIFWKAALSTTFFLNATGTQYLSDKSKSVFYVENYSYIEARLEQRLFDNHILALTSRNTLYTSTLLTNKIAAMLEYTIPLQVPISKRTSIGVLRGKIYEVENPEIGIPNVEVYVNELNVITDKEGNYMLSYLPPGNYNISINKFTLGPNKTTLQKMPIAVSLIGGEEKSINIGVIKSSSVKGKIIAYEYEEAGGVDTSTRKLEPKRGLPDFAFQLKNGRPDYFTSISNNRGEFSFPDVPAGRWRLTITATNLTEYQILERDSIEVLLGPGESREVEFRVLPKKRAVIIAQKIDTIVTETPEIKRDTAVLKPKITIPTGISKSLYFNERSDTLNAQTREYLDRLAEYLKTGNFTAEIQGHTDQSGSIIQQSQVAQLRADRIANYLVRKGVSRQSFTVRQYGARIPKVPNTTPSNRQQNRRAEVIMNPK